MQPPLKRWSCATFKWFEFMKDLTDRRYSVHIHRWLEDALPQGNGLKHSLGQGMNVVPELGMWALSRRTKLRLGMLFSR